MAKYRVFASSLVLYSKEVEASSADEAALLASTNYDDWQETGDPDWNDERVELVAEPATIGEIKCK